MIALSRKEREHAAVMLQQAQRALADNLMPFWTAHTWDEEHGGFLTRLDRRGRPMEHGEKVLMMQVRMLFSLAAAHQHGLNDRGYLDLAHRAFDYLVNTFWDAQQGGFLFSVTREGVPLCTRKNTDVHGYAMTALAQYAQASGRQEALDWADRVLEVLMARAADRDLGFIEDFDGGDWPALNAEQMNLGERTDLKTIDMHANMLEGLLYLSRISGAGEHRNALRRLLDLICAKGIHHGHGCTVTAFDAEWHPVSDGAGRMTTSYGLNVELAWFIWEVAALLRGSNPVYHATARALVDHALAFGFDHERGGLAAHGPVEGPVLDAVELGPERLYKSWWAQAEMINALCAACMNTQQHAYHEALVKTWNWVHRFQIDHEWGDWYQDTHWETGEPLTTDKGREFKTAFHAGRALMRLAATLQMWT